MMKFVFDVAKLKSHQIGFVRAHNLREGKKDRVSQVDKNAWFSKSERLEIVPWNQERLNEARALSKRKDAVEAVSFVIQVGNQSDWRDPSSNDCLAGRPKNPPPADPLKMAEAAKRWAENEFGKENVVSLELHLDESTPHLHLIVTPIFDGKLQAKKWLNGPKSVAVLRSTAHEFVNSAIPCSYDPGRGGEPHDVGKAAGRVRSENVAPTVPRAGLLSLLSGATARDNAQLAEENMRLQSESQRLLGVIATLRVGKNGGQLVTKSDNDKLLEANRSLNSSLNLMMVEEQNIKKRSEIEREELENKFESERKELNRQLEIQRLELDGLRKKHAATVELEQKIAALEQKNEVLNRDQSQAIKVISELQDEIGRQHEAYMELLNKRESSKDSDYSP